MTTPVQSPGLAAPSTANDTAKPPSKPPSKRGAIIVKSIQPTKEALASYGIKVRDFGYESTLPPIRPYVRRQIMPMPDNMEKRPNDDTDDESDARPSKKSRLDRELTEPTFPSSSQPATTAAVWTTNNTNLGRAHALADLSQFGAPSGSFNRPITSTPSSRSIVVDDGGDVPTPFATPNGSLHWRGPDEQPTIPAPQFDQSIDPSQSSQHKSSSPGSRNLRTMSSSDKLAAPAQPHQPASTHRYLLRSRASRSGAPTSVPSTSHAKTAKAKEAITSPARKRKGILTKRR